MAIRKEPGGITPTGDEQNQRIEGISNVAKTVNQMQRNIDQEITKTENYIEEHRDIQEIQSSMNGVLKRLSDTVAALSTGVKSVTSSAAMATKDAISQYGRAIGEDISWKKQNIVAMALARSTPIFGYFAAKFMETDVFKKAAARMREQVGRAFSGVANIFRGRKAAKEEGIPHMQHGGVVKKGGLAELHPAEVVMPIDELLERLDENMSTTRQLAIVARKAQLQSLGSMSTFVQTAEKKQRVGILKGFLRAYAEVNSQYLEPDSKRQLRALLAIQDALGAQIGTWKQVWQKMLIEHPMFRNIMFLGRTFSKVFSIPVGGVAALVKDRGGYLRIVSNASNPMQATAETLGAYAVESLWFQEQTALYTKATAEATRDLSGFITGKKYKALPGIGKGFWSFLGFTRKLLNVTTKLAMPVIGATLESLEGGWTGAKSGWKTGKMLGEKLTRERSLNLPDWMIGHEAAVERRLEGGLGATGGGPTRVYGTAEDAERRQQLLDEIRYFMLPYYKSGAKILPLIEKKMLPFQMKAEPLLLEYKKDEMDLLEAQTEANVEMNKRGKRQGIMKWLLIAGGFIKTMLGSIFGNLFKPITSLLGKGGMLANLARIFASPKAFASFLGPASAVLGAGAIGYGIGTVIERSLIAPIREKHFAELDAAKREAGAGAGKAREEFMEARKRVQAGKGTLRDQELMKAYGKTQGQFLAMSKERAKYIQGGFMERIFGDTDVLNIVTDAQSSYFAENFDQYMPYGAAEIMRIRAQFNKRGRGLGLDYSADPVKAGRKREEMFLAYLKKHGTPQYVAMEDASLMQRAGIKYRDVKTAAGEKVTEIKEAVVDKTKMATTVVRQEVAKVTAYSAETVKNIDKMADKVSESGRQQATAINNMTTNVVSSMSNSMASSVAAGKRGLSEMQEDLTAKILHGRMH